MAVSFKASSYVMTWCFVRITNVWTTQESLFRRRNGKDKYIFSLNYLFTSCGWLGVWVENFICFERIQSGMAEKWNNIYHYHLFFILLFGEKLGEGKSWNGKYSRLSFLLYVCFSGKIFIWFWVNKKFVAEWNVTQQGILMKINFASDYMLIFEIDNK